MICLLILQEMGQDTVQNVLTVVYFVCVSVSVCSGSQSGFAKVEDDEWSPVLELDGVGKMDLPNGQSSIITTAATVSEVRSRPFI